MQLQPLVLEPMLCNMLALKRTLPSTFVTQGFWSTFHSLGPLPNFVDGPGFFACCFLCAAFLVPVPFAKACNDCVSWICDLSARSGRV